MRVFPGMHYTMGGLWVDSDQMTNLPGLYACGECEYQYHGANRLGANSLISCLYGGMVAGPAAVRFARNNAKSAAAVPAGIFDAERRRQQELNQHLLEGHGDENPFRIWREMGEWMTEHATVIRTNKNLERTDEKLQTLLERYRRLNLSDRSQWANQSLAFCHELANMLQLARVIVLGARARNESRGAHYKPEFPERNDAEWMKTTKACFAPDADAPVFSYEPVDTSLLRPRPRRYDVAV